MNAFTRWALAAVAAAGLAIDAYVHLHIAHRYLPITTGTVNEGVLFRIEGALAVAAALWVLVRPAWLSAAFALLVAAGGATAVLVYGLVDVGKIGPLPNMYDPVRYWTWDQKFSLAGELAATLAALALLAGTVLGSRVKPSAMGMRATPGRL